ncbi:MAG: outer membrane protein transport protein [Bacteroidetes bacterium]|nr:outer membrane protein transport protein [Bacteroidota bacterium]
MLKRISVILVMLFMIGSSIHATNGYFRHGYGVKYSALAGAGTALSLSSIGAATNPASLSFLNSRFDVSLAAFSPSREFTITGNPSGYPGTFGLTPGIVESESNFFPIPTIGLNYNLNETMSIGLMFIANGGMNTDYETAIFYDPTSNETGVNLEQMFFGATYAIEFAENHSFGVTALMGYQKFAAKGTLSFAGFSSDPANISGNSNSTATGFGARFGYQGKVLPFLTFGASYQTKVGMSEFERYAGLFAEKGDFDVPATWNIGVAANANDDLTFALDVQQIQYSGVNSISNPIIPNIQTAFLGNANGAGFGWEDIMVYKFGVMYNLTSDMILMAGYSHSDNPVASSEVLFNILAPGVVQDHISIGLSKLLEGGKEINASFTYALSNAVSGANPLEAPNQQTIELQMSQIQFEVGYAFGF